MSFIEWKDLFDDIFEGYPDQWTLNQVHRNNQNQYQKIQNQHYMKRQEFARFHCPKCSKNWASAKTTVLLYYPHMNQRLGRVTLRFLGQECKRCSQRGTYFVDPEFASELIKSILEKLYERIGWDCYGKQRPPKAINNNTRRENNMKGPHEQHLCEACRMGFCEQGSEGKTY